MGFELTDKLDFVGRCGSEKTVIIIKKKRRCYVIKADQKRTMILSKQEENESGVGAGEGKRKKQQQPRIGIFLKQC